MMEEELDDEASGAEVRVAYVQGEDEAWIDAADRLRRDAGWHPVYWGSSLPYGSEHHHRVAAAFPGAVYHHQFDASRAVWPPALTSLEAASLDGSLLSSMTSVEAACLRMMDRMDHDRRSFPFDERVALYHRLLRRWSATLDALRPDVVVFPMVPHSPSEFVLYHLARRRGICTIVLVRTWTPVRMFPVHAFDDPSDDLTKAYDQLVAAGRPAKLPPEAQEHLDLLRGSAGEAAATIRQHFLGPLNLSSDIDLRRVPGRLADVARGVGRLPRAPRPHRATYMKGRRRDVTAPPAYGELVVQRWLGNLAKRRLRRSYEAFTRPVPTEPFVYVPLHFQPEFTTNPLGGEFVDLEHMVRLVADALPDGWLAVVKEHPWTFMRNTLGHVDRWRGFYEQLAAVPNVVLVSHRVDSLGLVDKARALATVSGTTGWEAVVRGTPVLAFGDAWYRGCDGIHRVGTVEDARRALADVAAGAAPRPERVDLFVEATESVSHRVCTSAFFSYLRTADELEGEGAARAAALRHSWDRWLASAG